MAEVPAAVPLMDWLQRQRRLNELQLELMAERFDFDGAVSAGQAELAWMATLRIVAGAARLYLFERGVSCPEGADWTGNMRVMLDRLASLDEALAENVWQFLLRPAPSAMEDVVHEATAIIEFATVRLHAKQLNREATVKEWADGVRLLRDVAVGLQVAGADKWYLRADDSSSGLSWYDEVMAHVLARSE